MAPTPFVERVEGAEALDRVAAPLRAVGSRLRAGPLGDWLSGTPLRHPAHPALVTLPIGAWSSALVLDVVSRQHRAARRLVAAGILAAVPAVASGLSDWSDTELAEQRVGLVHAAGNSLALACFARSWWQRRRGGRHGTLWSGIGLAVAGVAGWLGGHLAYGMGVGVDTNAFETGPEDWTPVGVAGPPLEIRQVEVDGVGIAVAVDADASVHALADRCSHRGGPLSEGAIERSCLVCPWHGSHFDLRTGKAVRGPASVPQPVYETRSVAEVTEIRRRERRGLRTRAV